MENKENKENNFKLDNIQNFWNISGGGGGVNIFFKLCNYGPVILFVISLYLLYFNNTKNYLFYYCIGFFVNSILNLGLKGLFKQSRPCYDGTKVKLAMKYYKEYYYQNGIPFNIYGMPSGHAQSSAYSLIFIYYVFKNPNLALIFGLITLFICIQRIKLCFHSIIQIIVGLFIGSLIGYGFYYLGKRALI